MTDIARRIRRLGRLQRLALQTALVLWIFLAVLAVLDHEWVTAMTSTGAAFMAVVALASTKARNIAIEIVYGHDPLAHTTYAPLPGEPS